MRRVPANKGGHPAPPIVVTQHPPFGTNGGCYVVTMGGAQHPPEENNYLNTKGDLEKTTQLNQVPNCPVGQLPSLWITSRRPTSAQGSR